MLIREVFDASVPHQRAQSVLNWLRTFGPVHPLSRIAAYAQVLADNADGKPVQLKKLFVALYEIEELYRASQIDPSVLSSANQNARIARIVKGGPMHSAEVDDLGRSVAFELSTLAFFLTRGNDAVPEDPADVTVKHPFKAFVECKRPTKQSSVLKNIAACQNWIAQRRPELGEGLGLAAIDLSCAINCKFAIAEVETPDQGMEMAERLGSDFVAPIAIKAYRKLPRRNGGLDAVMLRHRFVSLSKRPARITTHDEWVVVTPSVAVRNRLEVLMGKLKWIP